MNWGFGKVILLGEHSVVYGHRAVAGALSRGVRAFARTVPRESCLRIPAWEIDICADDTKHPVAAALRALLEAAGTTTPLQLHCAADIPPAAGLGSSAALAVAIARAISAAQHRRRSNAEIEALAMAAERCFHGTPSGIDVALATHGGIGSFRPGDGLSTLAMPPLRLSIGLSGEARNTSDMVERVRRALETDANARHHIDELGEITNRGCEALLDRHVATLGSLMNDAHAHLAALDVSTPTIEKMTHLARDAGALGAKLTGAGGGGAVIALAPGDEETICTSWRAAGFRAFCCEVGVHEAPPQEQHEEVH